MRRTWGRTMWVGVVVGGMIVAHAEAAVVICERKGKLRLRQDACTEMETQVDASELGVAGPQGPAGTDGAQGPEGPLGPQGVPGLSGVEVVTANGNVIINLSGVSSATQALGPTGSRRSASRPAPRSRCCRPFPVVQRVPPFRIRCQCPVIRTSGRSPC